MITEWRLKGFKAIEDAVTLKVGDVLSLSGINSSGKSTVIQSILMAAQTHSSRLADRSVLLNGHLTQLGTFADVRHDLANENNVHFGFTICPDRSLRNRADSKTYDTYIGGLVSKKFSKISVDITFGFLPNEKIDSAKDLSPELIKCTVTAFEKDLNHERVLTIFRRGDDIEVNDKNLVQRDQIKLRRYEEYGVEFDGITERELKDKYGESLHIFGSSANRALPQSVAGIIDANELKVKNGFEVLQGMRRTPANFNWEESRIPVEVIKFLYDRIRSSGREKQLDKEQQKELHEKFDKFLEKRNSDLVEALDWLIIMFELSDRVKKVILDSISHHSDAIMNVFRRSFPEKKAVEEIYHPLEEVLIFLDNYLARNIKYLGPLRDQPRAVYPLAPLIDPTDVGIRGENTAAVFNKNEKSIINYLSPKTLRQGKNETSRKTLDEAAIDWLSYLGVITEIYTEHKGKLGHEMSVKAGGSSKHHDLTHVGVGVSQVLPIVVMSLLAKEGDVLIFEQPELHLHPKVQTRLADFFVSLGERGVQTIIETHSEYFIDRFRLRIAKDDKNELVNNLNVYFSKIEDGSAYFEHIKVNRYGAIENWPEDFFDQSHSESQAIMAAGSIKKKNEGAE